MNVEEIKLPLRVRQTRRARILWYLVVIGLFAGAYFLSGWLRIGLAGIGAFVLLILESARRINMITVDEAKVTLRTGFLNVHSTSVYYSEITDINISQNIWERLLDYGKIYVNTPSHGEYRLVERNIPNPHVVRDLIEMIRHAHLRSIRKT
ncbi:MAG: PH domain-containing protein [Candidatus Woesearchaeota archaeon]